MGCYCIVWSRVSWHFINILYKLVSEGEGGGHVNCSRNKAIEDAEYFQLLWKACT